MLHIMLRRSPKGKPDTSKLCSLLLQILHLVARAKIISTILGMELKTKSRECWRIPGHCRDRIIRRRRISLRLMITLMMIRKKSTTSKQVNLSPTVITLIIRNTQIQSLIRGSKQALCLLQILQQMIPHLIMRRTREAPMLTKTIHQTIMRHQVWRCPQSRQPTLWSRNSPPTLKSYKGWQKGSIKRVMVEALHQLMLQLTL